MNPVFQSFRETVKHGLAIVLFILLLLGMMGAGLGIFSAGITALSTHQAPVVTEPAVPALSGGSGGYQGTGQYGGQGSTQATTSTSQAGSEGAASGSQSAAQSSGQTGAQGSNQNTSVGWSGPTQTVPQSLANQDLASRMDRKLRDMQSPVTGRLDTGGVALGDQVQSAFGHFLSGLLQTLFVEQAGSGSGAATGTTSGQVPGGTLGSSGSVQGGSSQGSSSQGTN